MTISFHSYNANRSTVLDFSELLINFALVCIWGSSDEVFKVVQKDLSYNYSSMIFYETSNLPPECKNIVFLDPTLHQLAIVLFTLKNLSWMYNIFVINKQIPLHIEELNRHTMIFGSSNAFIIDWKKEVYILSSAINMPRLFNRHVGHSLRHGNPKDLQGRFIPVAIFTKQPWVISTKVDNIIHLDGIEINFFNDLSKKYNFTWDHVPLKWCGNLAYYKEWESGKGLAGDWGNPLPNGTWRCGVGEALDKGEAEISFGNFWFAIKFLDRRDIGPCLTDVYRIYIVRRPEIRSDRWETLHKLLSVSTWLTFALAFGVTALVYWLANKVPLHQPQYRHTSLFECLFTLFGLVTLAGGAPNRPYTAHILAWWSLFALLITTALTSSIVTRLTLPVFYPRMDSFQQLVQNGYYIVQNVAAKSELKTNKNLNDTSRPWHYKFITNGMGLVTQDIPVRAKQDSKVTFGAAKIGLDIVVPFWAATLLDENTMSKYRMVNEYFEKTFSAIIFRKHTPVFPVLSEGIQLLVEAGIWEYHKREVVLRWASPAKRRLTIEEDRPEFLQPENLSLFKLTPIFYIHIAGLLVATIIFLLELIYGKIAEWKCCFQDF